MKLASVKADWLVSQRILLKLVSADLDKRPSQAGNYQPTCKTDLDVGARDDAQDYETIHSAPVISLL
jgi:hypothetical protein